MEITVSAIIGGILGGVIIYLWQRSKMVVMQHKLNTLQDKDAEIDLLKATIESEKQQCNTITEEVNRLKIEGGKMQSIIEAKDIQLTQQAQQFNEQFEAQKEQAAEQTKLFATQIELMKSQFKDSSTEILKERAKELNEQNKTELTPLMDMLKEQMVKIEKSVNDSREKGVEQKASLDTAIKSMMDRTLEIGNEATKLAEALKGKSKTQGLYGEMILSEILKRSGLREGEHFFSQETIRDEKGDALLSSTTNKRMVPDVIVRYPEKDLIIDSKVSLTAYTEWCNATTDEGRLNAAKQHIASIKSHLKEIKSKDYATNRKEIKSETIDYVVMFIPNEGALQLMRETDPTLWYDAYNDKIIIAGELSLFSLLKMIENFWTQIQQQKNQEEIIKTAERMLERVGEFNKIIIDIEDTFGKVQSKFVLAKNKLTDGKQSIAVSGRQLVSLGIKSSATKPLPQPKDDL